MTNNPENAPVARAGDTFPCGVDAPHSEHLFQHGGPLAVYRCAGDGTDTRRTGNGRRRMTIQEES